MKRTTATPIILLIMLSMSLLSCKKEVPEKWIPDLGLAYSCKGTAPIVTGPGNSAPATNQQQDAVNTKQ